MKRKPIRVGWFISFFVILLISMIPAALIYQLSIDAIEEQVMETNRAHQKLLEQTLEGVLEDAAQAADNLTVNSEFAFIRSISSPMTAEQRYRLYKFGKDTLRYMMLSDTFITQRYVYLKNSDMLLGGTYQRLGQAYNSEWLGTSLTLEEWQELLSRKQEHTYIPASLNMQKGVFYLRSLRSPTAKNGEYDATLVVFISSQAVTDVMTGGAGHENSVICVLDENDQLLLSNAEDSAALQAAAEALPEAHMTLNGKRYFCQISCSADSKLKYICYSSYETAYRQAQLVEKLSVIFLVMGLLFGLMVALAMTRQHYMPVKKIISRLEEPSRQQNEYDQILSYIEENQSAQQNLQKMLEEKQKLLRQEQLARFLTGGMQWNPDTLRLLADCHISLDRPAYAVAVVSMSEFSAKTGKNMAHNVAELMREFLLHRMPSVTLDDTMANMNLLVVIGMEAEEGERVQPYMQAFEQELRISCRMEMAIGLSNASDGAEHLPELYRQAAAALEFAQMQRESMVVCYPASTGNLSYSYPLEKEMLLVRAVTNGQAAQAMEILDEVRDMTLRQPNIVMWECLRVDLIATGLRIFAFADKIVSRESWEGDGAARQLMLISGLGELFDELRAIFTRLCGVIAGQRIQTNETQSGRIRRMVESQWQSSDLSVASIAERLNLHPSYVSRIFKEEQGINLLEYINRYRVEQAGRLLQETDMAISEIAAHCGYTSDASFIRVFRQYRGITPGKFREEARRA